MDKAVRLTKNGQEKYITSPTLIEMLKSQGWKTDKQTELKPVKAKKKDK